MELERDYQPGGTRRWSGVYEISDRTLTPTPSLLWRPAWGASNRGRDLGGTIIRAMKTVAAERGPNALIAPVRPSLKERYPLTPMERYVRWKREDGLSFDPWMRLHLRLGAEILCVAPRSMMITGTTSEWEDWTGMRFPESGPYVVPGASSPVSIDGEADSGIYEEPNIWVRHAIGGSLTSSGAG